MFYHNNRQQIRISALYENGNVTWRSIFKNYTSSIWPIPASTQYVLTSLKMLPLSKLYPSSQHRPSPGKAHFKAGPATKMEADATHHIKAAIFHPWEFHHIIRDFHLWFPFSLHHFPSSSPSLSPFLYLCLWNNLKFLLQQQSIAAGGCLFHIPLARISQQMSNSHLPCGCLQGVLGCSLPYMWTLSLLHLGVCWGHLGTAYSLVSEFNQNHLWWRHLSCVQWHHPALSNKRIGTY